MLCITAPKILAPITLNAFEYKTKHIANKESIPAGNENINDEGEENKTADRSILTIFTANAPLISLKYTSNKATVLLSPILMPGAIKSNKIKCSINPKTTHTAERIPYKQIFFANATLPFNINDYFFTIPLSLTKNVISPPRSVL